MRPSPRHHRPPSSASAIDETDPDITQPEFDRPLRPQPTAKVVKPEPSGGRDPEGDLMAMRFPQGVLVVDFRNFAPAVMLR